MEYDRRLQRRHPVQRPVGDAVSELLIAVPVLGRPHRAEQVAEAATETDVPYRLLFLCSPGDTDEIAACRATGADVEVVSWDPADGGDFAKKGNLALVSSEERWLFVVGDDTCFCPGWASLAIGAALEHGAGVVGTNDLGNPRVTSGSTAVHNLVARWYAEEYGTADTRPAIFHEGYDHNFVDDELVQTARARRSWVFCRDSEVPHLHPHWGHGELDATYRKGLSKFEADRQIFFRRRGLWRRLERAVDPGLLSR